MATDSRTLTCALALAVLGANVRGQQNTSRPASPPSAVRELITPALVQLGDSIFHGKVGGALCFGCHGADAKGTPGVAGDLTSGKWLHGDGSYAFLVQVIETGVPRPKVARAPMPPLGGTRLGPGEVRAVAAYVFSLTHPEARTRAVRP